ncbi:MAG: RdgB/HAM1 family non-canonical purine NTP pyrophosphatase [Pseudomonas sp.]
MTSNNLPFSQLVLASGNPGKLKELQAMLGEHVEVIAQSKFVATEAVEDGLSFVENAIIKARHACKASGLPALADDSGLAVDALAGAPGIYSARYAGAGGDAANNSKLLEALDGLPSEQRSARFISVLVLMMHAEDPTPIICEGVWHGRILNEPRGPNGFGYDPLFWVPETNCASAELGAAEKNRISHRAKAMAQLRTRLGLV